LGNSNVPASGWIAAFLDDPDGFSPTEPAHLIGEARNLSRDLLGIAAKLRGSGKGPRAIVLHGPPGCGKTCIAHMFCRALAGQFDFIQKLSGGSIGKETVAKWQSDMHYLQQGFQVIHIDELDCCTPEAKTLFLYLLENAPEEWVFIATTNVKPDPSTRFWSRWTCLEVKAPATCEITDWLENSLNIPGREARNLVGECNGNVRAAQHIAATYLRSVS
jgi:replication-associated recombination protein RarA